MKQPEH